MQLQLDISQVFINGFRRGLNVLEPVHSLPCESEMRNSVWAISRGKKFFLALYEAVLRFSIQQCVARSKMSKFTVSDNTGSNFNSTYHRYLSTDFDAVWCLGTSAQSHRSNPSRNSVWAIIGEIKFFVALYEAVLRFSI
jgi:hypothetical protein